jgi:hypothetical protein
VPRGVFDGVGIWTTVKLELLAPERRLVQPHVKDVVVDRTADHAAKPIL